MGNMRFKAGDRVKIKNLNWYNENKDEYGYVRCTDFLFTPEHSKYCGCEFTISHITEFRIPSYVMESNGHEWTDEMIEGLVEEETPKFKVNDIVFVKNIGWVRITNVYWDSLAIEYIYEAIGLNGEGEYDSINQSNIECQMLPESENPHIGGNKITLEEYKNNDKEWLFNKLAMLDNITALESIQDIFNHLQQSKYPKTYEECLSVLGIYNGLPDVEIYNAKPSECKLFESLIRLKRCRDAYWKIAGEEMGLGKPWEPINGNEEKVYSIVRCCGTIKKNSICDFSNCYILEFPTGEMRDAFYENFKELIESCKELL